MNALPFSDSTVFQWRDAKGIDRSARSIAYRDLTDKVLVILEATDGLKFIAFVSQTGALRVTSAPISIDVAVDAAFNIVAGGDYYGSIQELTTMLSLSVLLLNGRLEQAVGDAA